MSKSDRGVYQPSSDTLELYDPIEDEEDERSRLPLLIVIALLVVAAFFGVVWLAYNQGIESGRAGGPQIVQAAPGPVKTAPETSANGQTPYAGLKVYDQPVPPDEEAEASNLAPPPAPTSPIMETPQLSPSPTIRLGEHPAGPPAAAAPKPAPAAPPPVAVAAAQQTAPVATAPPRALPVPAAPAVAAPKSVVASTPASSAGGGSAMLQIGAYTSEDVAKSAWTSFQARHAATVAGATLNIQRADLGDKGVWYRLRVGPFADKSAAASVCEKLKAEGAGCFAAAP